MKSSVFVVSMIAVLLLGSVACSPSAPAAPASTVPSAPAATTSSTISASGEKVQWTFSALNEASAAILYFSPIERFQQRMEEASNGRFTFKTIVELVPEQDVVFAIMDGRADIGVFGAEELSGTYPALDFGALPFFFSSGLEYEKAVTDPDMRRILDRLYLEAGVVYLGQTGTSVLNSIFSDKAIRTVDDFQGLKIRASGLLPANALKMLGASPITMGSSEMTEALRRGTVDAALTSIPFGVSLGLADICDYISLWGLLPCSPVVVAANPTKFNALPDDLKQVLLDVSRDSCREAVYATHIQYEWAYPSMAGNVMEIIRPEKAQIDNAISITQPLMDEWLGMSGTDGAEILNIAKKYASGATAN